MIYKEGIYFIVECLIKFNINVINFITLANSDFDLVSLTGGLT